LCVALLVGGYDLWALRTRRETMSAGFHRALRHPLSRWPVVVSWAYLTAHLFVGPAWTWDPMRSVTARADSP
jgi:hypothetical protein